MQQPSANDRHVLMITYVFPPSAWVGVHRTLKYCKYLGEHGWIPVVLTPRTTGVAFKDDRLLAQVPPYVQIHRTFDFDPAKIEMKLAERKLKRLRDKGLWPPRKEAAATDEEAKDNAPARPSLWKRVKETIKSLLKDSPDSHVFWLPFAFVRGVYILLTRRIDVVYSTSPPHSTHMVAYLLAKCFRKPHVLDFRDPWCVIGSGSAGKPAPKLQWVLRWETRAKRAIVRNAAHIVAVSKGERDQLRQEYPEVEPARFTCITNGYDPADFASVSGDIEKSQKLVIIHAGTIYPGIAGEFFEALQRLVSAQPNIAQAMEVRLVGEIDFEYFETVRTLEATGLVKVYGLRPHAETLNLVSGSDLLLILMGGNYFNPAHLPSKMFEYLHAAKPILAIARDGELAEVARNSGLGIVVSPDDVDGIVQTLLSIAEEHATGQFRREPDRAYIQSFERASLAQQLAVVLARVVSEREQA